MHRRLTSLFPVSLAAVWLATPHNAEAAPPAESPVSVSVQVRAPFAGTSNSKTLWSVEIDGRYPFAKDFAIPYGTLEKAIDKAIDDAIPNNIYGKEVCSDPCPDVDWRIKLNPNFRFTKKGQPKLKQIGSSGQSKVRVELATEARLDLHAVVSAETWFDTVVVPVDVFVLVGMKASVDIALWPTLEAKQPGSSKSGVKLEFELVDTDLEFDVNGAAVALGFKWGTIIGFTPLGLLAGGPIIGPILAILGDAAADAAEAKINREFEKYVAKMFDEQTKGLGTLANDYIDPYIAQANNLKDGLLATSIPGTGKTLAGLQSDFGASVQLHTVASTSAVSSAAILRMTGAAAGGKIFGKVRLPKEVCEYASFSSGGVSGTLPLGLAPANGDLAAKVGNSCSAAVSEKLGRTLFRGANPRAILGASAENLATWSTSAGSFAYTGNVRETADWYECDFQITGLPKAAILTMSADDLAARGISLQTRYMSVMAAGKSRVFNDLLAPLPEGSGGNSSLVLGGKGKCGSGSSGGGLTPNKMKALKDSLNPANCPQCGLTKRPGSFVYEPADMKALVSTPVVQEVLAKVKTNKAQANKAKTNKAKVNKTKMNKTNVNKTNVNKTNVNRAK